MIRPSCYKPWGDGYTPPRPEEVKELLTRHYLSHAAAAQIVGVSSGRVVQFWTSRTARSSRQIPYSAWCLLLLELEPDAVRAA